MSGLIKIVAAISACVLLQPPPSEPVGLSPLERPLSHSVRVVLRAAQTTVPVGSPVVVEFVVQNLTDEPVELAVPGALRGTARPEQGMGLPLEHVFSGASFRGLEIESELHPRMGDRVVRKPEYPVPPIHLAPFGSVGLRFDVSRFYPGLHQSGLYRLLWRPYGGAVETAPLLIEVVEYKQIIMETAYGALTLHLLYDKAPRHVANFLDLVEKRFYNGKTFHTVYGNQFVLGGCPEGSGTGKRPDGVCLEPEFNETPFDLGTVGMALIESDLNSASCQFFICLSRQPVWDGRYTAFAQVWGPASLETLQRLGSAVVGEDHRPTQPLVIKSLSAVASPYVPRPGR